MDYSTMLKRSKILPDGGDQFGLPPVKFDAFEDLVWIGNPGGYLTGYGSELEKHEMFQVHETEDIRQLQSINEGLMCLTKTSLSCNFRWGHSFYSYASRNMIDVQCMIKFGTRLLMGGRQNKIVHLDLTRDQETTPIDVDENGCTILKQHDQFICAGNSVGRIDLRDPNTLSVEYTIEAHKGILSDFDIRGNYLVTCGMSDR